MDRETDYINTFYDYYEEGKKSLFCVCGLDSKHMAKQLGKLLRSDVFYRTVDSNDGYNNQKVVHIDTTVTDILSENRWNELMYSTYDTQKQPLVIVGNLDYPEAWIPQCVRTEPRENIENLIDVFYRTYKIYTTLN